MAIGKLKSSLVLLFGLLFLILLVSPVKAVADYDQSCWIDETDPSEQYCYSEFDYFDIPVFRSFEESGHVALNEQDGFVLVFRAIHVPRMPNQNGAVVGTCITDQNGICRVKLPVNASLALSVPPGFYLENYEVDTYGLGDFTTKIPPAQDFYLDDPLYPHIVTIEDDSRFVVVLFENDQRFYWTVYTQRSNAPYALNNPLSAFSPKPDLPQLLDNRSFDEKEVVIFTPIADLNLELQKTPLVVVSPTFPPSWQNDAPSVPIENPNSGFWIVISILVGLGLVIFVIYQRKNRKRSN